MEELTLREIQENSFKVLLKFKEICDNNDFKYYLAYGTLIGAVRHQGFIPWDDDIDVWMPRPDYEKFIQYCIDNEENIKPFELKHYRTCKEYIYPIARLSDSRYKVIYNNTKDYGLGLFIDIYPLDGIKISNKFFRKKLTYYKKEIFILGVASSYFKNHKHFKDRLIFLWYLVVRHKNLNKLLKKVDLYAQKYTLDKSAKFACLVLYTIRENYDIAFLNKKTFMKFEDVEFNIPLEYDSILKLLYGNYMELPPEEKRIAHHNYKVYKKDSL